MIERNIFQKMRSRQLTRGAHHSVQMAAEFRWALTLFSQMVTPAIILLLVFHVCKTRSESRKIYAMHKDLEDSQLQKETFVTFSLTLVRISKYYNHQLCNYCYVGIIIGSNFPLSL